MRRFWRRKWVIAAATVAVFLSVGAVAWAAAGDDPASEASASVVATGGTAGAVLTAQADDGTAAGAGPAAAVKKAVRDKKQQWLKRQAALMKSLRDDMTPADQAAYDQLVAKAKEQREELKQAGQALKETMKQLRDLADKYLDTGGGATG